MIVRTHTTHLLRPFDLWPWSRTCTESVQTLTVAEAYWWRELRIIIIIRNRELIASCISNQCYQNIYWGYYWSSRNLSISLHGYNVGVTCRQYLWIWGYRAHFDFPTALSPKQMTLMEVESLLSVEGSSAVTFNTRLLLLELLTTILEGATTSAMTYRSCAGLTPPPQVSRELSRPNCKEGNPHSL